jgi:hypothetical protein
LGTGPGIDEILGFAHNDSSRNEQPYARGESMSKVRPRLQVEEMLPEYDFSGGVRGKYAGRFPKGTVMVVLDPDVAELFPDPKSVNDALRALGNIIRVRARGTDRFSHR